MKPQIFDLYVSALGLDRPLALPEPEPTRPFGLSLPEPTYRHRPNLLNNNLGLINEKVWNLFIIFNINLFS